MAPLNIGLGCALWCMPYDWSLPHAHHCETWYRVSVGVNISDSQSTRVGSIPSGCHYSMRLADQAIIEIVCRMNSLGWPTRIPHLLFNIDCYILQLTLPIKHRIGRLPGDTTGALTLRHLALSMTRASILADSVKVIPRHDWNVTRHSFRLILVIESDTLEYIRDLI